MNTKKLRLNITCEVIIYDGVEVTAKEVVEFLVKRKNELFNPKDYVEENEILLIKDRLKNFEKNLKEERFVEGYCYGIDNNGFDTCFPISEINKIWVEIKEQIADEQVKETVNLVNELIKTKPSDNLIKLNGTSVTITNIKEGSHIKICID